MATQSIRPLKYPKDTDAFCDFFISLPHKTLMEYGRFNEQERDRELLKIQVDKNELGYGYFADNGDLLGYLHFNLSNKFSRKGYQASLGIVFHPEAQSLGFGSELLKYGLKEMKAKGYKKIWLHCHSWNHRAIRLYEKFGFKQEGLFVQDEIFDGKLTDTVSMAKFL